MCSLTPSSLAGCNLHLLILLQNLTSAAKGNFMLTFCTGCKKQQIHRLEEKKKKTELQGGAYLHQLSYSDPIRFFFQRVLYLVTVLST